MAGLSSPCPDTGGGSGSSPQAGEAAEEELWLYGGGTPTRTPDEDNGSTPGHDQSSDNVQDSSSGSLEQKAALLKVNQSCSDEDSDTDSDDVEVTIGDIHPSCMGPTGNQNIKGNRGYGAAGKLPPKGIDFAAPGSINGVPVLEVDLDSFEEKPWRKPGADITDYFNYGFNEATWKVYCEKQRRLQLGLDNVHHTQSKENKLMVQHGRQGNADKGGENVFQTSEYNNPACTEEKSYKKGNLAGTTDADVGEICSISRVEGRRWDAQEPDEVMFEVVGNQGYKPHGMMQHQQPPPSLPPPPTMPPNPPVYNVPPPLLFFQRPPAPVQNPPVLHPPVLPPPLVPPPVHILPPNGPPVTYNNRPPMRNGYYTTGQGEVNYHSNASNAPSSWMTTVNKGANSLGGSDWAPRRQREREPDRPRNQNLNNYKSESDRYVNYNRERNYDYDRKHRHNREHSWDREERPRTDQRHKDKDKDRDRDRERERERERDENTKHKSSSSSSSRRKQESEEKETHRRHKRKKSKKGKDEKGSNEEGTTHGSRHDSSD